MATKKIQNRVSINEQDPLGIAVLTHWHTGSRLLAGQLHACGMAVGNERTQWFDICISQMEHSKLNEIGDQIWLGNRTPESYEPLAREILMSYVSEAGIHGWKVFGVKFTHALYPQCWPMFRRLFYECWPNLKMVTIMRKVEDIFGSTRNPLWPMARVKDSYDRCQPAMAEIAQMPNGHMLEYPLSWHNGEVEKFVQTCGLGWNDEAKKLYKEKR